MRNALLFDDIIHFTDFVRVYGSDATSSKGFILYHVRDPERPARTQLALVGFRKRKGMSLTDTALVVSELQVEEKDGQLFGKHEGESRYELDMLGKSRGLTLLELIDLMPWREEPPLTKILFWLHDPSLMPRLVTDSFKLNNDRIQYAPLKHEDQEALLLRIESPSYYLLQWCQEQHPDDVDIFYNPHEDLYIEWGFQHPMEDLWRRSHKARKSEWVLFRAESPRQHVEPPRWQDIYKAAEFDLDFPIEDLWIEASDVATKFSLPLRFEPRARPVEPELWMLEEEEQHLLERLLSLVDEQDLKTLLISVQQDEEGKRRFFIREKHVGEGRKFLDFKGKRFASYKGFHNLLLPTSVELQPQLRRDQYRGLFELKGGELTILNAEYDEEAHKMTLDQTQLLKLRENSFEPITRLIDYIVESDKNALTNILERTLFDFSHYAKAPRRDDLMSRPKQEKDKGDGKKANASKKGKGPKKPDEEDEADVKKLKKKVVKKVKKTKASDEETEELHVEPTELEKEEARIERLIVQEGQHPDHWSELSDTKSMMRKWLDAVTSSFEGMWLLPAGEAYRDQRTELVAQVDKYLALTGNPAQRLKRAKGLAQKNADPMAVAAFVLHGNDEGEDRIDEWLQEASGLLRQVEDRMRKKERWLLWREIFLRNGDVREQARVREDILKDLNENGITNHDVPIFIQERLFQERWLQESGDSDESTGEVGAAYRNLELISEAVEQFPLERLKAPGLAILARAFGRIGHHPRAKALLDQARRGMDKLNLDTQGWIQLYTFQAIATQSKSEGKALEKEFKATCKELEKQSKNHFNQLKKMEASLEERKELENLSEYLSKENNKRLFPSNTSGANAAIKSRIDAIESSFQAGEMDQVGKEVLGVLEYIRGELTGRKKDPDFRTLAWLLDSAIATLSKLKWGNEGRDLIRAFEDFVTAIPPQPPENSPKLSEFYFTLLHLAMAEGLVALGSEPHAMQHLQELLDWTFDRELVALDYVDMCSKALNTIEVAQLKNRQDPLRLIMRGMLLQLTSDQTGNSYDNPSFAAIALKLLDQTVEVALSKEKLTLGLFKRYTDQDELLIRERIFTEDVCS